MKPGRCDVSEDIDVACARFDRSVDMVLSAHRDRGVTIDRFCRILHDPDYAEHDPLRVLPYVATFSLQDRGWAERDG